MIAFLTAFLIEFLFRVLFEEDFFPGTGKGFGALIHVHHQAPDTVAMMCVFSFLKFPHA